MFGACGDSFTTSLLFRPLFFTQRTLTAHHNPICWRCRTPAKSFTKTSSLYNYMDEVLMLVSIIWWCIVDGLPRRHQNDQHIGWMIFIFSCNGDRQESTWRVLKIVAFYSYISSIRWHLITAAALADFLLLEVERIILFFTRVVDALLAKFKDFNCKLFSDDHLQTPVGAALTTWLTLNLCQSSLLSVTTIGQCENRLQVMDMIWH